MHPSTIIDNICHSVQSGHTDDIEVIPEATEEPCQVLPETEQLRQTSKVFYDLETTGRGENKCSKNTN